MASARLIVQMACLPRKNTMLQSLGLCSNGAFLVKRRQPSRRGMTGTQQVDEQWPVILNFKTEANNHMRLAANGDFRTCLYGSSVLNLSDLRDQMREGGMNEELLPAVKNAHGHKPLNGSLAEGLKTQTVKGSMAYLEISGRYRISGPGAQSGLLKIFGCI